MSFIYNCKTFTFNTAKNFINKKIHPNDKISFYLSRFDNLFHFLHKCFRGYSDKIILKFIY